MRERMKSRLDVWVTLGLCLTAAIWGAGFIFTQIAIDEGLSASFIMFVRFGLASMILGIMNKDSVMKITKSDMKIGGVAAVLMFLGFTLQTIGLRFTTPSSNAFITATSVVMVPFFSWIIFKKRPEMKAFIAAIICFSGIGVLATSSTGGLKLSVGDSFTLLCAIAFALHVIAMSVFAKKVDHRKLTFLQITVTAILSFIMFMVMDRDFYSFASIKGLLAVVALAIFSTCVCYSIQTVCQKYASPSKVSIITSTESLVGTVLSVSFGFEPFTPFLIVGGAAILLSVIIIDVEIPYIEKIKTALPRLIKYEANQE